MRVSVGPRGYHSSDHLSGTHGADGLVQVYVVGDAVGDEDERDLGVAPGLSTATFAQHSVDGADDSGTHTGGWVQVRQPRHLVGDDGRVVCEGEGVIVLVFLAELSQGHPDPHAVGPGPG